MRIGLLIILIGALYLFQGIGYISPEQWGILWPIVVILIGITILTRDNCPHHGYGCGKWCTWWRSENGCGCDCASCGKCDVKDEAPRKRAR